MANFSLDRGLGRLEGRYLAGLMVASMTKPQYIQRRKRSARGTSLIEMLVVIVIFLIGILAIVQIFPKGFQILGWTRNESVAAALSRDEVERLKAHSDQLPDQIYAAHYLADGTLVAESDQSPLDLGPKGTSIGATGILTGGPVSADWTRLAGANNIRHIQGEGRVIPAPTSIGSGGNLSGGLMVLNFGPVDFQTFSNGKNSIVAYGNDLVLHEGFPNFSASQKNSYEQVSDSEFYVDSLNTNTVQIGLPAGPLTLFNGNTNLSVRTYSISVLAYVKVGSIYEKKFFSTTTTVPNAQANAAGVVPIYPVSLSSLIPSLGSIDPNTLRVRRAFQQVALTESWDSYEPYTVKLLNPNLGVLLFSPFAFGQTILGPTGRVPLQARVDYDAYDWRILRDEFRFPSGQMAQHVLPIGSIKVGTRDGFDGRRNGVIGVLEDLTVDRDSDNFVLVDLATGGIFAEHDQSGVQSITINKSNGLITVRDLDAATDGTQADLVLPDGTVQHGVTIDNRAVRALFRANGEYSVQVLKAPASYTETTGRPSIGQFAIGANVTNGVATRIYFPPSDLGSKVTVGVINYNATGTARVQQIRDVDFVIKKQSVDATGLPSIDITDIDKSAVALNLNGFGYAVNTIKGSSVTVRTLWNPDFFRLYVSPTENIASVDKWGRGWRRAVNETYLEQGSLVR